MTKWDEFTKLTDEASIILIKATKKRLARNMSSYAISKNQNSFHISLILTEK
jgi:hypothetical protein